MKSFANEQTTFYIELFNQFCISGAGKSLNEDEMHSKMLVKLFVYMYCHKNKKISIGELVDALWDTDSVNPAGALKNLVYRLRMLLKQVWPEYEFIIAHRGSYIWNHEVSSISDGELLDDKYESGLRAKDSEEKLAHFLEAIALYRGKFLPKMDGEQWVIPRSAHYHSMYLSIVKAAAAILDEWERYEQMEHICHLALQVDQLSETLHYYFIKALLCQNKIKVAEVHYKKAVELLYDNLGISPSEELANLYADFLKETRNRQDDLGLIQQELSESSHQGSFLCEFGMFRKTYHLEQVRAERFGISMFLALITVEPIWEIAVDSPAYLKIIKEGMAYLEQVLLERLRSGDVVSRYSVCQYIVLLPSCQYETAKMVMKRIDTGFCQSYKKKTKAKLSYKLDEIR
ncbi:MAG: hypothetical protein FWE25_06815 [Lachnospiraceae bacterium]|nr:hypothetical protein [Lachnospiraceae bacterium]